MRKGSIPSRPQAGCGGGANVVDIRPEPRALVSLDTVVSDHQAFGEHPVGASGLPLCAEPGVIIRADVVVLDQYVGSRSCASRKPDSRGISATYRQPSQAVGCPGQAAACA